ncbi:hypothetical protein BD324DRAFT_648022 [Kockovaella imperatae]|uniref:Ribosomal protein L9 domain-containing protein n=1 Tax=Kockovaella imperatae TaxID=4999 RepID=A0A1Y1USZ4_9TREE|nr:hypothetical protein BD324DRAFT_648022 [Kockovaella imperatae]ORX41131.1 hypothetical protein BD324DRAFT_648022 [Kockovaella imperatae]
MTCPSISSNGFLRGLKASTSVLNRPLNGSIRAFSTSSPALVGKPVLVELLQRVPGLGHPGDRVHVVSGRARLDLVPLRKARWVPFAEKFGLGPSKANRVKSQGIRARRSKAEPDTPTEEPKPFVPITPTPAALKSKIDSFPPVLDFNLQTVSMDSSVLITTFTLGDITNTLKDYGLTKEDVLLRWEDGKSDRIERVGERVLVLQVRGRGLEEKKVTVRVHRTSRDVSSWAEERALEKEQAETSLKGESGSNK